MTRPSDTPQGVPAAFTFDGRKGLYFRYGGAGGLLRAISFLGPGACFIGIGFLYQRFGGSNSDDTTTENPSKG